MNNFFESITDRLFEIFNPETLGTKIGDLVAGLIVGLVVLLVFLLIQRIIRRVSKPIIKKSSLDQTAQTFVSTIVHYTVIIVGILAVLSAVGINIDSLLASIGIAGVTIGFAARDAFSNLISGLLIFLDRPFVIGDLVEVGEFYGHVEEITLRSTRIITSDGKMLAVPNNEMINKTVASYTNFPNLRLDIPVTVGVGQNLDQVRQLLLQVVKEDPQFLSEPEPRVVVTALNDYNVAMELQAWLENERQHVEMRSTLRERVFRKLNEANVDLPFETFRIISSPA
ncbi:MAG: mechanosensitive ion channel family protein [Anaerolineales bacterium]|nr:mechanosensitive ion channel family protein [Anaerolineales bacterium]